MNLKDITPDFGADLQHPEAYLVGAIELYGLAYVRGALDRAALEVASKRGGRVLVRTDEDGTPIYRHLCGVEYAGERDCPACAARSLDDAEALGLRPRDPEVA
jgi:hypothetical protein